MTQWKFHRPFVKGNPLSSWRTHAPLKQLSDRHDRNRRTPITGRRPDAVQHEQSQMLHKTGIFTLWNQIGAIGLFCLEGKGLVLEGKGLPK